MDFQNVSNTSSNEQATSNETTSNQTTAGIFIAIGSVHFTLIVLPTLLLGSLVLPTALMEYKKSRTLTSVIFILIVTISIIGAATHGLLMDLSLISNIQFLGGCNLSLYWILYSLCHTLLAVWNALLSIIQYAVIRWRQNGKLKLFAAISMTVIALLLLINSGLAFSRIKDRPVQVRGSYCPRSIRTVFTNLRISFSVIVFYFPSLLVIGIFTGLTHRYIKHNTIENSKVVKTILKFLVINAIFTTMLRPLPVLGLFWLRISEPYSSFLPMTLDLNYPLQIITTITIHKGIRTLFKERICLCDIGNLKPTNISFNNRVEPSPM